MEYLAPEVLSAHGCKQLIANAIRRIVGTVQRRDHNHAANAKNRPRIHAQKTPPEANPRNLTDILSVTGGASELCSSRFAFLREPLG